MFYSAALEDVFYSAALEGVFYSADLEGVFYSAALEARLNGHPCPSILFMSNQTNAPPSQHGDSAQVRTNPVS